MKERLVAMLGLAVMLSPLVGALPASANVSSATITLGGVTPGLEDDISQAGVTYTATFAIAATIPAGGRIDAGRGT